MHLCHAVNPLRFYWFSGCRITKRCSEVVKKQLGFGLDEKPIYKLNITVACVKTMGYNGKSCDNGCGRTPHVHSTPTKDNIQGGLDNGLLHGVVCWFYNRLDCRMGF